MEYPDWVNDSLYKNQIIKIKRLVEREHMIFTNNSSATTTSVSFYYDATGSSTAYWDDADCTDSTDSWTVTYTTATNVTSIADGGWVKVVNSETWKNVKWKVVNSETWKNVKWNVYERYVSPSQRLKQIMQSRCAPNIIIARNKAIGPPPDIREVRARETLRRVLGDKKFSNFMKKGFVSVKANSGRIYQIFPGHGVTNVYENGQKIERLCVVLNGDFPETDSIIMRFLMLLNNEDKFRNLAIKHHVYNNSVVKSQPDQRSLVEIFKSMKKVG